MHVRRERRLKTAAHEAGARARVDRLLGAWFHGCREHLGWSYGEWAASAATELVDALLEEGDPDEAAVLLGAHRARSGVGWDDALCEISILLGSLDNLPGRGIEADDEALVAALGVGHASALGPSEAEPSVGRIGDLAAALRRLYEEPGASPRDGHALVVLDLDLRHAPPDTHGHAVHLAAHALREHFPGADQTVGVGRSRFAVLVRRHPGLAVALGALTEGLTADPRLAGAEPSLWLRALPERRSGLGILVRSLVGPSESFVGGHRISSDPLVLRELQIALSPPAPPTPPTRQAPRRRRRLTPRFEWRPAVGAAAVACSMAAGLVAVVPADRTGDLHVEDVAAGPGARAGQESGGETTTATLVGLDRGVHGAAPEGAAGARQRAPGETSSAPAVTARAPEKPAADLDEIPAPPPAVADRPAPSEDAGTSAPAEPTGAAAVGDDDRPGRGTDAGAAHPARDGGGGTASGRGAAAKGDDARGAGAKGNGEVRSSGGERRGAAGASGRRGPRG